MTRMVRTHILLPQETLEELDRRVGLRKRSETISELVEAYLQKQRRVEVMKRFTGSMDPEDHPEWATQEDIDEWVREERRASERAFGWRDDGPPSS